MGFQPDRPYLNSLFFPVRDGHPKEAIADPPGCFLIIPASRILALYSKYLHFPALFAVSSPENGSHMTASSAISVKPPTQDPACRNQSFVNS